MVKITKDEKRKRIPQSMKKKVDKRKVKWKKKGEKEKEREQWKEFAFFSMVFLLSLSSLKWKMSRDIPRRR